jgi:hypothetical protein
MRIADALSVTVELEPMIGATDVAATNQLSLGKRAEPMGTHICDCGCPAVSLTEQHHRLIEENTRDELPRLQILRP